jgi:pimeloyl-ACP methyl ester carboxylesterase
MLRWLMGSTVLVLALAAGAFVVLSKHHHHHHAPVVLQPTAFYTPPAKLPHGPPGMVIRSQALVGLPVGERGWRILYLSNGAAGQRMAVSGMLIVPSSRAPVHGRHIVAFAHPAVGVARRCAPSIQGSAYAPDINGLHTFLKAGDAVAITDYPGLGTPGTSPYLIGTAEARAVIDSVRAAHQFKPAQAGKVYAVLGSSQGGQAALYTAMIAASYAPKLTLAGVAATAPVTRLATLFAHALGTAEGNIVAAFTIATWVHIYPAAKLDTLLTRAAQPALRRIAATCSSDPTLLEASLPRGVTPRIRFRAHHPWRIKAWARLLHRNTPGLFETRVPILITQGDGDRLVAPGVTTDYVRALCSDADTVDFRLYPGIDNASSGAATAHFTAGWIAGRFAHRSAPTSCAT